jgi:hypothetical protein
VGKSRRGITLVQNRYLRCVRLLLNLGLSTRHTSVLQFKSCDRPRHWQESSFSPHFSFKRNGGKSASQAPPWVADPVGGRSFEAVELSMIRGSSIMNGGPLRGSAILVEPVKIPQRSSRGAKCATYPLMVPWVPQIEISWTADAGPLPAHAARYP